jgi:hypothetical protein
VWYLLFILTWKSLLRVHSRGRAQLWSALRRTVLNNILVIRTSTKRTWRVWEFNIYSIITFRNREKHPEDAFLARDIIVRGKNNIGSLECNSKPRERPGVGGERWEDNTACGVWSTCTGQGFPQVNGELSRRSEMGLGGWGPVSWGAQTFTHTP